MVQVRFGHPHKDVHPFPFMDGNLYATKMRIPIDIPPCRDVFSEIRHLWQSIV